ncbi:MAG: DUF4435 domain-containing protein [Halanaerobiales bacterium]|nr:DUF4435 domain-containing protein [Halanaerobiales bacterium]
MSLTFKKVSGGKFDFIEDQEVKNLIEEAGRKKVVFVEGDTDVRVFLIFYDNLEDKISFIPVGNHHKVKEYLEKIIDRNIEGFVGIIDRDFMLDADIDKMIKEFNNMLYIHNRYTLENYLIESEYLLELIKDNCMSAKIDEEDVKKVIQEIFKKLQVVMAGNMTLLYYSVEKLKKNIPPKEDAVLKNISSKIKANKDEKINDEMIQTKYITYLESIRKSDGDITKLNKMISGKYFFYNFKYEMKHNHEINIQDNTATIFHLARILKTKNGIKGDLLSLQKFLMNSCGQVS